MSCLDLTFNNELSFNKQIKHQRKKPLKSLSIDNIDFSQRKIRINSPTSLKAMKELGYKISDLEYLYFRDYIRKNPDLYGKDRKTQEKIYSHIENLRKSRFQKIKDLRNIFKTQNNLDNTYRNSSCYNLRKIKPKKINYLLSNSVDIEGNKEIEKEKKTLERIKHKNETELFNKIQFELKRELMRQKNEDKIRKQTIKYWNYQSEMFKKKKEEELIKFKRELELAKKQKELELYQKKMHLKRYNEEILRAKEKEKQEKERQKELELKHKEEEIQRLLFQKKMNDILQERKLKILEKAKSLELKELNKRRQLELKNKAQQELNMKKSLEKQVHVQQTLRNYEIKREEIRRQYEMKEKQNEEKEKRLEEIAKKENKIKLEKSKKKEEEIKSILERNKAIKQKKIDDYNEKQKIVGKRREIFERNNELMRLERLQEKEEKEQRAEKKLNENKTKISIRKEEIIKKIKLKEYNTQQFWKKQQKKNEIIEDYNLGKRLEKEFKVKENEQHKLYMINEAKIKLDNRDKRIENFLREKNNINKQKKIISEQINKQKQLYSDKIQNIFHKNIFNKKNLKEIKNIFSNSQQISNAIDKFGQLIKDEEE